MRGTGGNTGDSVDRPCTGMKYTPWRAGIGEADKGEKGGAGRREQPKPKDLTRVQHSAGSRAEAFISDGMLAVLRLPQQ